MGHIGLNINHQQPSNLCLSCRYWQNATPYNWGGYCRLGYCKKNKINRKNKKERRK